MTKEAEINELAVGGLKMSRAYDRGVYFERRVRSDLQRMGWVVFRTAGSHSIADLIALRSGEVELVQCKVTGEMSSRSRENFKLAAQELGVVAVLAYRDGKKIIYSVL